MMNLKDRRLWQRVPTNVKVQYSLDGRRTSAFSTDISPSGIFIEGTAPPPVRTRVALSFTLTISGQKRKVEADGIVERIVDRDEAGKMFTIPGFGVKFHRIENDSREVVEQYVREKLQIESREISPPMVDTSVDSVAHAGTQQPVEASTRSQSTEESPRVVDQETEPIANKIKEAFVRNAVAKNEKSSVKGARKSQENREKNAEQAYLQGLAAYRRNDLSEALEKMTLATRLNPNKPSYFNILKEMREAMRNSLVLSTCNDVEELLREGKSQLAEQKINACREHAPNDYRIIRLKAQLIISQGGNIEQALTLAGKALSLNADDPENYYVIGLIYKALKRKDRARAMFQKAVNMSNHEEAARELVKLLM